MQVQELMNSNVVSITPEESASLAARLLTRHNVGSLPVCSNGQQMRGIITDRDIVLRCVAGENDPQATPVREIMSKDVVTITPGEDVRKAASLMAHHQIRRLPVVDNGRLVGMLSLGDMAKNNLFNIEASKALSEISENWKKK
ncbi:MAG: CBS domain-containing protein [Oscillospiraceae bacterium]|nr:CBS domain-containing protein [Oscillospiraceae bacterium]